MCAPSMAQAGAALRAAAGQDLPAVGGGHALAEAVDLGKLTLLGYGLAVVGGDRVPLFCGHTVPIQSGPHSISVANVVKNGKGRKVLVFKYKPKKNYRRRQGHRQPYTKVEITKVSG